METDAPTRLDLACAWAFPSVWRYVPLDGTMDSRMLRMSCLTLGSVFSLIVTAAVVWGTNTWQAPRLTPLSRTTRRTVWVMSMICWLLSVLTVMVLRFMRHVLQKGYSPFVTRELCEGQERTFPG